MSLIYVYVRNGKKRRIKNSREYASILHTQKKMISIIKYSENEKKNLKMCIPVIVRNTLSPLHAYRGVLIYLTNLKET